MQDSWIDKAEHEIRDDIVAIAKKIQDLPTLNRPEFYVGLSK